MFALIMKINNKVYNPSNYNISLNTRLFYVMKCQISVKMVLKCYLSKQSFKDVIGSFLCVSYCAGVP